MPKLTPEEIDKTIIEQEGYWVNPTDPFDFERFCGSCMFIDDPEECPFYGQVLSNTAWATDLPNGGCKKFYD